MHRGRTVILCGVFWCLAALGGAGSAAAQLLPQPSQPPPPPEEPAPDPYHAEKSMEIGRFYMKKGKYDAAIDRFLLAIQYQPKLALPRKLIAEACEKKNDKRAAIDWYEKYLEVFPQAEDGDKVRKRIETLTREIAQQKSKRKSP